MTTNIKTFCPCRIQPKRTHLVLGNSVSGKSSLTRHLIQQLKHELEQTHISTFVYVFCGHTDTGGYYNLTPREYIYENVESKIIEGNVDSKIIEGIIQDIKTSVHAQKKEEGFLDEKTNQNQIDTTPHYFFVFSDMHPNPFFRERYLRDLLMNGRFYNATVVIEGQYDNIPSNMRHNMNYIYITNGKKLAPWLRKVFDYWGKGSISMKDFRILYEMATREKYKALVIDHTISNHDSDQKSRFQLYRFDHSLLTRWELFVFSLLLKRNLEPHLINDLIHMIKRYALRRPPASNYTSF